MYVVGAMFTVKVIAVGLVAEWPFAKFLTGYPWWKALWPTVAMNAASATIGAIALLIAGIGWEIFPGLILYQWLRLGTFNPITWSATFVMAVVINSIVESLVLKKWFGLARWRRAAAWLLIANSLSMGVAAIAVKAEWLKGGGL